MQHVNKYILRIKKNTLLLTKFVELTLHGKHRYKNEHFTSDLVIRKHSLTRAIIRLIIDLQSELLVYYEM